MPRYIIHHNGAFNMFTTIADGACFESACSEESLKKFLGPLEGAQERFDRAKETGCSGLGWTLDMCIDGNRAGDREACLPKDEFLRRFLMKPGDYEVSDHE